jgi:hypothetical protein
VLNANRQWQYQLAQVCADNALIALRLSSQLPGMGERSVDCTQAQRDMRVVLTVAVFFLGLVTRSAAEKCASGESIRDPGSECAAGFRVDEKRTWDGDGLWETVRHDCYVCPAGTYSANTSATSAATCLACPAGQLCAAGTLSATANPCAVGTFSAGGLSACTACAAGYCLATVSMTGTTGPAKTR